MSWTVDYLLAFHNWWNKVNAVKKDVFSQKLTTVQSTVSSPSPPSQPPLLRLGVLSAAAINNTAIWDPVATHPSTVITGLAARDKSRAEAQIASHKRFLPVECKAYGSYASLLNAEDIDAVYIPLPNGLHHKWTLAALEKGKHVLIEKPIASNAQQAREIRDAAARAGKVALEAFHWRFHPSAHVVKQLLLSGDYGRVIAVDARAVLPGGVLGKDDIRFKYDLAGGCCMDLTYVFSAIAYFAARDVTDPNLEFEVVDAKARLNEKDKLIDEAITATLKIKDPNPYAASDSRTTAPAEIKASLAADLSQPKLFGIIPKIWAAGVPSVTIQCDKAEIVYENFMGPWLSHKIAVVPVTRDPATNEIVKRGGATKRKPLTLKQFKGGPLWDRELTLDGGQAWWTTYRWQLEAFARMIREGAGDGEAGYKGPWVDMAESIRVMEMIDSTYEKLGLPLRGA
ncbi:uncharacterized protein Z519_11636 [Cladophialophora bantiana CBS 173.52]|uniref:D-xylose 1-dehydrogenase (NADP(+), D-xylono-1,5-lactone-forming) n=1 Tax=Cladophialophora bantiana (strain ATCC 10958 / CBS 173.52 / CDC B-1940 / NIH 8579) TaxID=1442370 RepID=A0A0D2FLS0_CLAB1|nr:uncharacterized protein Z519_11636 [Cladophialophora bantiana CBS 173.52]KIW87662.1 hypothetical protein Z519_11636 [Cladophialophora bantiana CBS 173.52]